MLVAQVGQVRHRPTGQSNPKIKLVIPPQWRIIVFVNPNQTEPMKILTKGAVLFSATLLAFSAHAKIITVNTEDNTDFTAGKTNLVKALSLLADGDTINFN